MLSTNIPPRHHIVISCTGRAGHNFLSPIINSFRTALDSGQYIIDHAIIPMRDLYSAAESRRDVTRRAEAALAQKEIHGGLWHTRVQEQQEIVLANQFYKILYTISKRDIPMTLLSFPRFVRDSEYLYRKLEFRLNGIEYQKFLQVFKQIARPELVHDFFQRSATAE